MLLGLGAFPAERPSTAVGRVQQALNVAIARGSLYGIPPSQKLVVDGLSGARTRLALEAAYPAWETKPFDQVVSFLLAKYPVSGKLYTAPSRTSAPDTSTPTAALPPLAVAAPWYKKPIVIIGGLAVAGLVIFRRKRR